MSFSFDNTQNKEIILSYPNSIMPYIYHEQLNRFQKQLDEFKYITLNYIDKRARKIIDFLVKESTPNHLLRFVCSKCNKKIRKSERRLFNNEPVCSNCKKLLLQGRFAKSKPRKGVLSHRYLNR